MYWLVGCNIIEELGEASGVSGSDFQYGQVTVFSTTSKLVQMLTFLI
jgi:hypothetical protein